MRGLGLPQPHTSRTSLCDLPPDQLAAEYRAGMQAVREWVGSVAQRRRRRAPAAAAQAEAEAEEAEAAERAVASRVATTAADAMAMANGNGRVWGSGKELAGAVRKLVESLNANAIPTAGSVIDSFNNEAIPLISY